MSVVSSVSSGAASFDFIGQQRELYDDFAALLRRDDFAVRLASQTHVAVACSGGADSLALALLLGRWCRDEGKLLTALIVDHGLRAESAREARFVVGELSKAGIRAEILSASSGKSDGPGKSRLGRSNIQAAARDLRYGLLSDYCRRHSIGCLFLGHHLQDQAETYLLRLRRGSHIKGLGCMEWVHELSGAGEAVYLLRPLLSVDKERLRLLVDSMDLSWVSDPSNDSELFERVRMRKLLPLLDSAGLTAERLSAAAEHMRLADDFIAGEALPYLRRLRVHSCGYISAERDLWRRSHGLLHYILLADIWRRLGFGDYPPRARSLASLAEVIIGEGDLSARVLGGVMMFGCGDEVLFCREYAAMDRGFYDLSGEFIWDGRFRVFGGSDWDGYVLGPGAPGYDCGCDLPREVVRVLPLVYCGGEVYGSPLLNNLGDGLRIEVNL